MALSVVDLYRDVLPKTNCKDCSYPTCLAFASMVVSEKLSLKNCPHLDDKTVDKCTKELEIQYKEGKWLKKDMAQEALEWAKEKAASMKIEDLPERIGGTLCDNNGGKILELPYFKTSVLISENDISKKNGSEITRYEKVFLYIHMAQGGSRLPTGNWKGLVDFPNTISKMKSMKEGIEIPLINRFKGKKKELSAACEKIGGKPITKGNDDADVVMSLLPLPRIPVKIVFWDEITEEKIEPDIKFLFDETITDHLDIESIMFLSEQIKNLLMGEGEAR